MRARTASVSDVLDRIVRRVVRRFDPDRIVLFGSRARGTAGPDSDTDLLVVMPVRGSKHEKEVEVRCALHDIPIPKDIVVVTPEEVARYGKIVGTLIFDALREGKVLYVRSA